MALRALVYWLYRYRRTWQATFVVSVANPLLFLLAIGAGLGTLVNGGGDSPLHGVPYLDFFAPGMLAAASMQNAYIHSAFEVNNAMRREPMYRVAAATPLEPQDILAGHLMFIAFRITLSALVFVVVMAVLGATSSPLVVLAVPAAVLTAMAFATPLAAWAITVGSFSNLNTVFRFVLMPLYLFSGTFFSIDQIPGVLRPLAYVLPLWHGVDLCRTLSLGTATLGASLVHVVYLVALAVAGVVAARVTYRRFLHV